MLYSFSSLGNRMERRREKEGKIGRGKGRKETLSSEIKSKEEEREKEKEAGLHDDVLRIGPKVKAVPGGERKRRETWRQRESTLVRWY